MTQAIVATGKVESLCVNGKVVNQLGFYLDGPRDDVHRSFSRQLSGHDGGYIGTSALHKGNKVLNWRTWTGLSTEELSEIERELGAGIPQGCLLENITVSGILNFSQLSPTTRLVFPHRPDQANHYTQAILAVWEENGPCRTVGERLEKHHGLPGLKTKFIDVARNRRGVMGLVLAAGLIQVGDIVLVYPPIQ